MVITNKINFEVYKKTLFLAVPMMIQTGITNAVGLVDNLMVGSLGTESITAVSIVTQLLFVFSLTVFGGLSGPGIFCAQYFGSKDNEGIKNVFRLKIWVVAFCFIISIVSFKFWGDNLIALYLKGESANIDADKTLNIAKSYLQIMLIGLFPFCVSQIYGTQLKETNDSIKPMLSGVSSVICDVVFNYLLIFGHFGFPKLGVQGAAIATVISRFFEMAIIIIWSHKRIDSHLFLKNIYSTLKVPAKICLPIIKKGVPIFINEFLWSASIAFLTQCYSLRGLDVVAGNNISNTLCNLLNVVFVSFGTAVGIIIGQILGAKEFNKAKKEAISLTWFALFIGIITAAILISLSDIFPKAYNTSESVRFYGKNFIIITALFFPVQSVLNSLYFTLRSGGRTVLTFVFDSGFSWIITIPSAYGLCLLTNLDILKIFAIIQALDLIKVIVGYVLVKKGIWVTNLIEKIKS